MRLWLGFAVAVASIVLAFHSTGIGAGAPELLHEQPPAMAAEAGDLMGFVNPNAVGGQQVTIVNASRSTMLVYHVNSETGQITLQSSRRLTWDFSLDQYNATTPLPTEIRQMVER